MGLQALALERGLAQAESVAPLAFRDYPAKPLFDQGFQRRPLSLSQLARLLAEAIWNFYGRFHMANHITQYTKLSMDQWVRVN